MPDDIHSDPRRSLYDSFAEAFHRVSGQGTTRLNERSGIEEGGTPGGPAPVEPPPDEPAPDGLVTASESRLFQLAGPGRGTARYGLLSQIGEGGMGRVMEASDAVLGRHVAVKLPASSVESESFLNISIRRESQLAARLEHPNIVPVYDIVRTQEGRPGYVMRRLNGSRLSQILLALRNGEAEAMETWGRVRLLTLFAQVVAAMAYAHQSRIIHRDLKPNNLMIGSYGEVVIIDWGLAIDLDSRQTAAEGPSSSEFVGAVCYISPEQMRNDIGLLDVRSDVYSLGAILYEILTFHPPFMETGEEPFEVLKARVAAGELLPPSQRSPERRIPETLDEICLKCLRRMPSERYQTALALHQDVLSFLEGTREQEWQLLRASVCTQEAEQEMQRFISLHEEARQHQRQALEARLAVAPWDPIERKRPVWNMQQSANQQEEQAMSAFNEAEKKFLQALGHCPTFVEARRKLAELYYHRFLHADARRNLSEMSYFEARVQALDDSGAYRKALKGDGVLKLVCDPPDAQVTLYTYREIDRCLMPVEPRVLGRAPVVLSLPVGSYLVLCEKDGYETTRLPVLMGRLAEVKAFVRLYLPEALGTDFALVPAGPFQMGGDPEAFCPELEIRVLDDFAMGRFPVRVSEYLTFINALAVERPEEALARVPRSETGPMWVRNASGQFMLPTQPDSDGDLWRPDFPVFSVSFEDAQAYAQWRSRREGRTYRLPTAAEWEKAARGVDGRLFPWGDVFEATYCKNRDSMLGRARPEPVGLYPRDVSPYGVRDVAGGVSDWTVDSYPHDREFRVARGGNWTVHERSCRLARSLSFRQKGWNIGLGFRLCFSLKPAPVQDPFSGLLSQAHSDSAGAEAGSLTRSKSRTKARRTGG